MIDINDPGTLLHGDDVKIAALLNVNKKTVQRWKRGEVPIPEAVRLLMSYLNWGDISAIGGKEWEGFSINKKDHLLNIPGWKYGFEPNAIKAMFFKVQLVDHLKRELKLSEEKLEKSTEELRGSNKKNDYYRQQLHEVGNEFKITPKL